MKNLKKVLALVVALTMVLGTVAFAGYTDVAEDSSEYTAVSTLSSLGILTGYEDGSFNPTGDITRAEFCAVVCRALGAKVSGSAVTGFSDVPADHWASAYISYVAGLGIVNGMGDGTFAPDANVTFEQAVKMLVVALGFEPMAAQKGGYPTGYMVVANTYGITEAISAVQDAPASRAIVSQLVYNALDVPMMDQTGFGTQINFEILDGSNGKLYKTLLTGLDVTKLDGSVVNTSIIGTVTEEGYVDFKITDDYDSDDFAVGQTKTFAVAEGVDAEGYFGFASTVFVKELAKNKYEIIAIMPGADSQTLDLGIEEVFVINQTGADYVEYYTDADHYDTKKAYVADSAGVYYNNASSSLTTLATKIGSVNDIEIKLVENTGDNKYDVVIVKEYTYDRVDSVDAAKGRIEGISNRFVFDFEDEDKLITIVDKNGDAIGLEDFAEDDVIAFISNNGNGRTYSWIEVINLGQSAVEGTIDELETGAVYVDGAKYEKATMDTINLGDEGTFFLTRTGKIFDFEKSASVAGNYGYILGTALASNGGWESAWEVKILTKDNEVETFKVKDEFDIFDAAGNLIAADIDQAATSAGLVSALDITVNSAAGAFKTNVANRLITYKLDAEGLIREIHKVNVSGFQTGNYNADAEKLFTAIETDALIFNVSGARDTSAYVTNIDSLIDDNYYEGYYITNADGDKDCLVITLGGSPIDYTQDIAVVTSVTTTKVNNEDAKKVRYYVSGEDTIKELIIMNDSTVSEPATGTTYASVKEGSLLMFTDDGNGTAAAYAVLANIDTTANANSAGQDPIALNTALVAEIHSDANIDTQIVTGYIKADDKVSKGTKITAGDNSEYVILGSSNTYTLDLAASKFRAFVGEWDALEVDSKTDLVDSTKGYYFVAKIVDDKVADFVTYGKVFQID